ncbi:glycine zipper 2TM domain-containing protein [Verminephrobacter sp. Larva24]|uniref:glycine zipper 2TM domain-containing protein n=1 Tax=Verminephrobacter eiseniae TaxID=364317 RepID=UPI0010E7D783|nr:glycine zipper 2TM domain-containing protein [Verminephrobacter eiseniae]KAB7566058.1 glycine zipper 2TM domain-containing protein [Verminephrobacter sp. Larva24]MCW5262969.1 glycine zipper 2TM domain-containing protein [Verminephrobacter eiseniae]
MQSMIRSCSRSCIRCGTVVGAAAVLCTLAACGHQRAAPPAMYPGAYSIPAHPAGPAATEYGRIANIQVLPARPRQGQTSGAGAVLGAVVGGVLGNQIGAGTGRAAATAVGVLGGAVAGDAIESRQQREEYVPGGYRLFVQLDRGGQRAYDVSSPGDLRIGDRVRLYNGQISRW